MKKIICWLLTLAICLGLAACGTPAPAETTASATTVPGTTAPAVTDPAPTVPATTEPAETQPAETEPAVTEPALSNPGDIIAAAYALADGEALAEKVTLTGTVSSVDTAWSEQYQNITVTMKVAGYEDKPVMCYRLAGEGAKDLAYGDVITVTGIIKNYMGIIEFQQGCTLDSVVKGTGEGPESPVDYDVIVEEAKALKPGQSLPYVATLTGRVESIDYAYSAKYNDMSITIEVRGQDIYCYRLTSPRTDWLKQVGEKDWVTVMGKIKNYNGTIEFDGATMIAYTDFYKVEGPEDPLAHIDAAYALKEGKSLDYESTLTGVITGVDTPWSDQYKNITVTIQVPGREDKPIQCYRLSGEGADGLAVGDTITVTGTLKNYMGKVEFDQGCEVIDIVKGEAPVEPEQPEQPEEPTTLEHVTSVSAGTAYKLGMNQTVKESIYFFTGTMSGYYGASENNYNKGVDVYLEETTGGFHLYFTDANGAKQYINLVKSGTHYNFTFGAAASSVFDFDEDKDALCTEVEGELCYIGTYGSYVTFGVLQSSKLKDTDYLARLYVGGGSTETPDEPDDPATPDEPGGETGGEDPFVKPTTPEEIVNAAYALAAGETLQEGPYTLTGVITQVNTAYSAQYGNVTVTIQVGEMSDKLIECFRLTGEGADVIDVGDTITVTGQLKNYNGKIEFDAGCTLDSYVLADDGDDGETGGEDTFVKPTTPEEIVNAAYALAAGETLQEGPYTLTGVITKVDTPYNSQFGNVTVTIQVGDMTDKPIQCFRLQGEGADVIGVGYTVTVTGQLKNYVKNDVSTIEFDAGCTLDAYEAPQMDELDLNDPASVMDHAYALASGEYLQVDGENVEVTLTGKVVLENDLYNSSFGNLTVTLEVDGREIQAYRLSGTDADKVKYGDTITVKGKIKNYNGTIEFDKPTMVEIVEASDFARPTTNDEIMAAAGELGYTETVNYLITLTGKVQSIDTAYSSQYKNMTVTVELEMQDGTIETIQCYQMKASSSSVDITTLAVGDEITVTGYLATYKGNIQMAKGCKCTAIAG